MKYFIGIDGGGTKTAAVIQSEDGSFEHTVVLPGSNNTYCGIEESLAIIKRAVTELCDAAGAKFEDVVSVFAGVAGATANNYISFCTAMLRELLPNASVGVNTDASNLMAMLDGDGAVMICGTGSICFVCKDGESERLGGYADLDPLGSGTHIGKFAIMHCLQVYDGRKEDSELNRLVEEKLGATVFDKRVELMKSERSYIASFTPLVFDAARSGDIAAMEILECNFEYLAHMVNTASKKLGTKKFQLVLGGGIFRDSLALELLKKHLICEPDITICDDQSKGALRAARRFQTS